MRDGGTFGDVGAVMLRKQQCSASLTHTSIIYYKIILSLVRHIFDKLSRPSLVVNRRLDVVAWKRRTLLETVVAGTIEEKRNLLEGKWSVGTAGLDKEEVDVDDFECEEDTEHNVVLPVQGVQCDRVHVLVENKRNVDSERLHHKTLGPDAEWQDFNGVRHEKGRHGDVVETIEKEDKGQDTVSGRLVGPDRNTLAGVAVVLRHTSRVEILRRLGVQRGTDGPADESDAHTSRGGEEEETTSNLVDRECSDNGPEVVVDLEDTVDKSLVASLCDSNTLEDLCEVIRDETVTRPLREEGDGNDDAKTTEVSLVGEKVLPRRRAGGFLLETE